MAMRFDFTISARDGRARTGAIAMRRGTIRTPAFMTVGTAATVKAMRSHEVRDSGADIILGNCYHLMVRPGAERIARLGGLHRFMSWEHPILTDSGGYQVMSLKTLTKVTEEGVLFSNHIDGARHLMTPESVISLQSQLGSDIAMVLDECPAHSASPLEAKVAMERSMRWAARARTAFDRDSDYSSRAALFGIQQGALDKDMRAQSAEALQEIGFDGYAIGGLAVGEGQEAMFAVLDYAPEQLPDDCPRYLMGVGKPDDIIGAVARGVDMFDCVLPTRSGRNGQAFTHRGALNLRNAHFAEDQAPLDEQCTCPTCQSYSRAYLHHLVRAKEILAAMLLTTHNVCFYQNLMKHIRTAISAGQFDTFAHNFLHHYREDTKLNLETELETSRFSESSNERR